MLCAQAFFPWGVGEKVNKNHNKKEGISKLGVFSWTQMRN